MRQVALAPLRQQTVLVIPIIGARTSLVAVRATYHTGLRNKVRICHSLLDFALFTHIRQICSLKRWSRIRSEFTCPSSQSEAWGRTSRTEP